MTIKKIKIVENKKISTLNIRGEEFSLKKELQSVYQNDSDIKNIIMENTANRKLTYGMAGCRFVMGVRMINYALNKKNIDEINLIEFDRISDSGGWKKDAWADGYYGVSNPIENVINFKLLTDKINGIYGTKLKYEVLYTNNSAVKKRLRDFVKKDIPLGIKMDNILTVRFRFHFVNINSVIINNNKIYFKMLDTYETKRNSYTGLYTEIDTPYYYEVIY